MLSNVPFILPLGLYYFACPWKENINCNIVVLGLVLLGLKSAILYIIW